MEDVIRQLQAYKALHNLSVSALARHLDVPQPRLHNWLYNNSYPSGRRIASILAALRRKPKEASK